MFRPPSARPIHRLALATIVFSIVATTTNAQGPDASKSSPRSERIQALFLGDKRPPHADRPGAELLPSLAREGIDLVYTDDLDDLNPENLARFDALVIYANHETIDPDQEAALLGFVEGGKGLVVLHCGSYCFLNSPKYVALVGGQFLRHGGEVFAPKVVKPDPPRLEGVRDLLGLG